LPQRSVDRDYAISLFHQDFLLTGGRFGGVMDGFGSVETVLADSRTVNWATKSRPATRDGKITREGHALFNAASTGSLC